MAVEKAKNKVPLTKRYLEGLAPPAKGKRLYVWDEIVRSLVVDVTPNGRKVFYVRRKIDRKRHIVLIGPFPEVTIEQARRKAMEICGQIAAGLDPNEQKLEALNEPTLGELFDFYIERHAKMRLAASDEIQKVLRRYLSQWRERKMSTIKKAEVAERINEVGRNNGLHAANHTITYARAAINWCIKAGLFEGDNPWNGATKFRTQSRERFLRPDEIGRFLEALRKMPNNHGFRDYVYISLFTGARRSNVFAMRWEQIDFALGIWTIPRTKNGDSQMLPLTHAALQILKERYDERSSEWVFPADSASGHLEEPKKAWKNLLKDAEIENLRLHDLRRTLGSYMAMGNQSLHMIGKVLGHKNPASTQIYARFTHDPIRSAMEKAQVDMLAAARLLGAPDEGVSQMNL